MADFDKLPPFLLLFSPFRCNNDCRSSSKRGTKPSGYNTTAVSNLFTSYIDAAEEDKTVSASNLLLLSLMLLMMMMTERG